MATDKPYELRVRLDRALADRLDRFAVITHRNLTQSVNLLLDVALKVAESGQHLDDVLSASGEFRAVTPKEN